MLNTIDMDNYIDMLNIENNNLTTWSTWRILTRTSIAVT